MVDVVKIRGVSRRAGESALRCGWRGVGIARDDVNHATRIRGWDSGRMIKTVRSSREGRVDLLFISTPFFNVILSLLLFSLSIVSFASSFPTYLFQPFAIDVILPYSSDFFMIYSISDIHWKH